MVKMVITDLDNTLLRRDKSISDYTKSVFGKLRERGILIAIATARSSDAAAYFTAQMKHDAFIGHGGALVLADGKEIHRLEIPADISQQLLRACLSEPEITAIYANSEAVALTNYKEYLTGEGTSHYTYSDFSKLPDRAFQKITVISRSPSAVERISAQFPMLDVLGYTGEDMYRFANSDAVKWNAVKLALAHYKVDAADAVAFGDDFNDVDMLRGCGTGVAVANAIEECKAAANHICGDCDDDGVAKWLEEHVL